MASEPILMEYWLRSFSSWLASILLDVAVGGNVVQEPAHAVFTISKISFFTKPTVILSFSTKQADRSFAASAVFMIGGWA